MRKLGSVDKGSSHLDFHALEQQRGITIYSKQAAVECCGTELTLLDTPGHVDFSAEAERTLQALDYAVLVVDAHEGVRGHTETLWRLLRRHDVPTFIFANKMDLCDQPREHVTAELTSRLSDACVDFSELACSTDPNGQLVASLPPELAETCAATDELAIEEFFEAGTLAQGTMQRLVSEQCIFPVFFGSALKQEGVDALVHALSWLVAEKRYASEFGARVFKVSHDPSGARLSWLKVTSGKLEVKQLVEEACETGAVTEKVDQIRRYSGAKYEVTPVCHAGQICAVTGLSRSRVGMALGIELHERCDDSDPARVPTFACGIILNGCDVQAVHAALRKLTDEDPLLNVQWNERLQELQVQIMGTVQLEVLQSTLHERFGLDVDFGPGSVLYRETIAEPVTGIGHFEPLRHYAEVHLRIEPLPAGSGVQFGTCCHVDELDLNWQRLILTNAMEREHLGTLTGSPITDVRITLIGGRAHAKHTEGGDFRQATYRAIRQGLMQAEGILLEPWHRFTLRVPSELIGRAFSDLQRMGARYDAPRTEGAFAIVEGIVPAREINDYTLTLNSYTHGEGSLALEFHGYERCHDEQAVVEQASYDPEADLPNTPDSIFCSHGAGHTVKWSEVPAMAHVKPDPTTFTPWREADPAFFANS